jgi:uncharacterized protein (DUF1499 family)
MKGFSRMVIVGFSILAALAFLLWIYSAIASPPERKPVDFTELKRTGKPNDYLVCPEGSCNARVDETSPVFEVNVLRLKDEWTEVISDSPRTVRLPGYTTFQADYEQRSRFLGFPDTISVLFTPLGENQSTLAIYSRSHYGYWDLGVNRKRIQLWLSELNRKLNK